MELIIKETLEKLLEVMGIQFTGVTIQKESDESYYAQVETSESSLLIGWHGETITALQHILRCLLWKQGVDSKAQIVVDVDGYKKRQSESVLRLAKKKAEYALENNKQVTLPPMNGYFRRSVHVFLASDEHFKDRVMTESVGSGTDRAVKIIPK